MQVSSVSVESSLVPAPSNSWVCEVRQSNLDCSQDFLTLDQEADLSDDSGATPCKQGSAVSGIPAEQPQAAANDNLNASTQPIAAGEPRGTALSAVDGPWSG